MVFLASVVALFGSTNLFSGPASSRTVASTMAASDKSPVIFRNTHRLKGYLECEGGERVVNIYFKSDTTELKKMLRPGTWRCECHMLRGSEEFTGSFQFRLGRIPKNILVYSRCK